MWFYEKKLEYPVNIKTPNARTAKYIIDQLGGPDGELSASLRYMHQRYSMKQDKVKGLLTDIATEELAHVEMISAILYQLTQNLTPEQIKEAGFDTYFVDHTLGIYPQGASGAPFTAAYFQCKGDPITDLTEDLAADGAMMEEQPIYTSGMMIVILMMFHLCSAMKTFFIIFKSSISSFPSLQKSAAFQRTFSLVCSDHTQKRLTNARISAIIILSIVQDQTIPEGVCYDEIQTGPIR